MKSQILLQDDRERTRAIREDLFLPNCNPCEQANTTAMVRCWMLTAVLYTASLSPYRSEKCVLIVSGESFDESLHMLFDEPPRIGCF